jgi:hypothetical protein
MNPATLNKMISEATKAIDFESEVIKNSHTMSRMELNREVDKRISIVNDKSVNVEIRERSAKEARVLSLKLLRY